MSTCSRGVDPRSCMLCCSPDRCHTFYVSRMPSQCCVLSYKAVPFLHSARATVASLGPRPGPASPPGRAPGAGAGPGVLCATRCACGCPRAPGVGRTLGRGGWRGRYWRGRGGAWPRGWGPRQSPRRKPTETATPRIQDASFAPHAHAARPVSVTRPGRDRPVMRQGPSKASYLNHGNTDYRPPRPRSALARCCTCVLFRAYGSAVTGLWSRAHTSTSHIHIALRALSHWQSL